MAKPVSGKTSVVVHPLVLLSVVDHYNRSCQNTKNRAIGVLLGFWRGADLEITNSFAGESYCVLVCYMWV
jgi:26S proteasome regulatory subunit N8